MVIGATVAEKGGGEMGGGGSLAISISQLRNELRHPKHVFCT